jgi:hypothetical protein
VRTLDSASLAKYFRPTYLPDLGIHTSLTFTCTIRSILHAYTFLLEIAHSSSYVWTEA